MHEPVVWSFLFGVLSVYPFFPLRHVPVMDRLRIPFRTLMLYATAIMVVQGISFVYLSGIYPYTSLVLAWHRKLFMVPYVLLTLAFSKDSAGKTLFMDFTMVGIVMFTIDTTYIIAHLWFAKALAIAPYRTDALIRGVLTLLLYPPLYLLFKKSLRPIMGIKNVPVWRSMTAISLVLAIISILTTMEAFGYQISPVILCIRFSVIGGSLLVTLLLARLVRQMEGAIKAEERSNQAQRLLALQSEQYAALTRNIEQTRAARHNLRHQFAAISAMVAGGEYDKLEAFVADCRQSVPTDSGLVLCENYAANSVLSHYVALARKESIDMVDIHCALPNDSRMADIDLCVLLGNLMENAIEGCKTLPPEQRRIKVRMNDHLGQLLLTVDNTFDGVVVTDKGELTSRKRGNGQKGIGLASVEAIAQKYGGEIRWVQKDGWFLVSVPLGYK